MATLSSVSGKGVVASRPAAGIAGQTYFATDVLGGTLQRDNGSTWDNLTNGTTVQLQKTTLGVATATFSFTSIPGVYSALELLVQGRGDTAATQAQVFVQFNADTGANYDNYLVQVNGTTPTISDGDNIATTSINIGYIPAATAPANTASSTRTTIANYAGTTFHKDLLCQSGMKQANTTASMYATFGIGWWRSTSAITTVTVLLSAGNFVTGSVGVLYGVV